MNVSAHKVDIFYRETKYGLEFSHSNYINFYYQEYFVLPPMSEIHERSDLNHSPWVGCLQKLKVKYMLIPDSANS